MAKISKTHPTPQQILDKWGIKKNDQSDDEEEKDFSHKCVHCGTGSYIDDQQRKTPNFCDTCEKITRHKSTS